MSHSAIPVAMAVLSLLQAVMTMPIKLPNGTSISECLLTDAVYMSFVVRIMNHKAFTISTGNILTPSVVLTACSPLFGLKPEGVMIEATVVSYNLSTGPITQSHFLGPNVHGNRDDCLQERAVKTISCHKRYSMDAMEHFDKFNVAVLVVKEDFKLLTERIPSLPVISDVHDLMSSINRFNALRSMRCEVPVYATSAALPRFEADSAVRPVPFHSDCYKEVCRIEYPRNKVLQDLCKAVMADNFGFILCAKRVKQANPGITYWDGNMMDSDRHKWNEDECDTPWVFGAPLMCQDGVIGIVTGCSKHAYLFTTTLLLKRFIQKYVDARFVADKTYFMDSSVITTEDP